MWLAGVVGTTSLGFEKPFIFIVLKEFIYRKEKRIALTLLSWDLRKSNLRWNAKPWMSLGAPTSLRLLDMADDPLRTHVPTIFQGYLPDFAYRLLRPEWLLSGFVLKGITPLELFYHMTQFGHSTEGRDKTAPLLALEVAAMGRSWVASFVHSVLQAIFMRPVRCLEKSSQLIDGRSIPQLDRSPRLFWLHTDDFPVLQLEVSRRKSGDMTIRAVNSDCRKAIGDSGRAVQKEARCANVRVPLGMEITPGFRSHLQVLPEKEAREKEATRVLLDRGSASSAEMESLLRVWEPMLPQRFSLSVLAEAHNFMRSLAGFGVCRPSRPVQAELWGMPPLLSLFSVDLTSPWHPWAYQVDALLEVFGAVSTRSWAGEQHGEGQCWERKGWTAQAEQADAEMEGLTWDLDEDFQNG